MIKPAARRSANRDLLVAVCSSWLQIPGFLLRGDSLQVLVSDVAQLDEVGPQAVHLPVRLSVVLHLGPQVFLQMDFAVVNLPQTTLQLLVINQKAAEGKQISGVKRDGRTRAPEPPKNLTSSCIDVDVMNYLSRSLSAPSEQLFLSISSP